VPWCGAEVYEAAEAFADRCLVRDDSLFTPGRPVAMLENAEALQPTVARTCRRGRSQASS
jgi:hypothetical protein